MTAADVRNGVQEAVESPVEAPRPLRRALPPAEPYPVEALGPLLRDATLAIADFVQVPLAIAAQSVVATVCLAVQGHADVVLPFGQTRPMSLFLGTLADSGDRKTTADRFALQAVREYEQTLRVAFGDAQRSVRDKRDLYEAQRRKVLGSKDDSASQQRQLNDLVPPPEEPLTPLVTCDAPTWQGLLRLFREGHPSLGLFATESGSFLGGFAMSVDQRLNTAAGLSKAWDGEPLTPVRAGEGAWVMPGRRLAVHLLLQPEIAWPLLNDRLLTAQGLLSRFLIVAPDSLAGTRFSRPAAPGSAVALARYVERVAELIQAPPPLERGTRNELAPRQLPMSAQAQRDFYAFSDLVESQVGSGGDLANIRGFANKLGEHVARLAGVLGLADDLDRAKLDDDHFERGTVLGEYYLGERQRLNGQAGTNQDILQAEQVLTWLQTAWSGDFALPEVYQLGPPAVRDKRTAEAAVNVLADHGWVVRLPEGGYVGKNFRRVLYRLVRT